MNGIIAEKNKEIDSHLDRGWRRIGSYKNYHTKIEFECPKKHKISMRWEHYQRGIRCSFCSGLRPLRSEDIDKRLDKGWRRLTPYVNNSIPMLFLCPRSHFTKMKWQNYQQGKRCIHCFKELNRGSNHRSWKPELTAETRERRARKNIDYKEWRKAVYKQDNYQCQVCGQKSKNLHAHHLRSFHSNKDLRYDAGNGVTMCKSCHIDFHKRYGKDNNTPKQFDEYKKVVIQYQHLNNLQNA